MNEIHQNININNKINNNCNQNNLDSNSDYSFSNYKKAITTGLKLQGDTSYFNSVLYALSNIRNIVSYFLNPKNKKYINDRISSMPVSFVFERLLIHLYPYPEKAYKEIYEPNSFFKVIGKLNSEFNTFTKKNPNDLIVYIINTLHKELNQMSDNSFKINFNLNNKKNLIKEKIKYFKNYENSIISNNLNWFEIKECQCTQCNNKIYDLISYNTFSLDIQKSYQFIKNNKNNSNNYLTIYDCLEFYRNKKREEFKCNNCNNKEMDNIQKIFSSPNNFVFLMDRREILDDINKLLEIPFHLDDKIDLNNFIENDNVPKEYELIVVVSFCIKEKKYVSYCRSPVDKMWYFYKDEFNKKVDIEEEINRHNNYKEFIPYILIYKSK